MGNNKMMRDYHVTTGIVIAYKNSFDVDVYNIQKPTKDAAPLDYSQEYFTRIMLSRKLNNKKKNEKTLANLVK